MLLFSLLFGATGIPVADAQEQPPGPPPTGEPSATPTPNPPKGSDLRSNSNAPLMLRQLTGTPNTKVRGVAPHSRRGGYVAKLLINTRAMTKPDGGKQFALLSTKTRYTDSGTRLLVTEARYNAEGRLWVRVIVPLKPTVRKAWIDANNADITFNPWFVSIDLRRRTIIATRYGIRALKARVVVGKPSTPSPTGLHAIYEKVPSSDGRKVFTGSWALHLTAFSRVVDKYGAGDGRAAIHGRGDEALKFPLGTAASMGCVRVDNRVVETLARRVPIGTPVRIK